MTALEQLAHVGIFDVSKPVPAVDDIEPRVSVRMGDALFPINGVESVRILQDTGYLDLGRDPEDLYREITTGVRHDPETQSERDYKRLCYAAAPILAQWSRDFVDVPTQAAESPDYIDAAYRDDAR